MAEPIIGLLSVFFISSTGFLLRTYGVANLLSVHSFKQFHLISVREVIFHSWRVFLVHSRLLLFWSHVTYLTLKNDFLALKLTSLL